MKISSKSTKRTAGKPQREEANRQLGRGGAERWGGGEEPEAAAGQASRSSLEFLLNAKRNGSKIGTRGSWMEGGGREEIGEAGIE